jgi:hypothetical protein
LTGITRYARQALSVMPVKRIMPVKRSTLYLQGAGPRLQQHSRDWLITNSLAGVASKSFGAVFGA